MTLSEYTQVVRDILESLHAPEIVELGNEASLSNRMFSCVKKVMPGRNVIQTPRNYAHLNPAYMNEQFNAVADLYGIVWAYWKTVQIPEMMRMVLEDCFIGNVSEFFYPNDWKELGQLVLECIYAADWPNHCFQAPSNCSICLRPMYKFITTTCDHCFHQECFENWISKRERSNCPLCRAVF